MAFHLNLADLAFILKQIEIAERHVDSNYTQYTDGQGNPIGTLVPYGLRTVSGLYNNLTDITSGASGLPMPRLLTPTFQVAPTTSIDFDGGGPQPATTINGDPLLLDMNGPAPGGQTSFTTDYSQIGGYVIDAQPRLISNLISDQTVNNPAALIAALTASGSTDPYQDAGRYQDAVAAVEVALAAQSQAQQTLVNAQEALAQAQAGVDPALAQALAEAVLAAAQAQQSADTAAAHEQDLANVLDAAEAQLAAAQIALGAAAGDEQAAGVTAAVATAARETAQAVHHTNLGLRGQALLAYTDLAAHAALLADEAADAQTAYDTLVAAGASEAVISAAAAMRDAAQQASLQASVEAAAALDAFSAAALAAADSQVALTQATHQEQLALDAFQVAQDALAAAQNALAAAQQGVADADAAHGAAQEQAGAAQTAADNAAAQVANLQAQVNAQNQSVTDAQAAVDAAQLAVNTADAATVDAAQAVVDTALAIGLEFDLASNSIKIPNVMPDLGDTAPFNSFMTLFGQFFDHGLDLVTKGESGTVLIPLAPDDPLYVPGSATRAC